MQLIKSPQTINFCLTLQRPVSYIKTGEETSAENIRDMIDIFLTHNENELPAQDLKKLLPLCINAFDELHVSKKIESLKETES